MTWVGKDTAVSEGARAKLHSSAMPCDDPSARNPIRSFGTRDLRIPKTLHLDEMRMLVERPIHFTRVGSGSQKRHRQTPIADAVMNRRPLQCSAERRTIVAGSRLDIDLVKQTGAHQLSIRCAIQRDAPGQR